MRLWFAILAMTLPACGFSSNGSGDDDMPPGEAGVDAPQCFGSYTSICFDNGQLPTTQRTISTNLDIDTTNDTAVCDQHNSKKADYCVVAGAGITIDSGVVVKAFGSKPLVFLSTSTFTHKGTIDVASHTSMPAPQIGAGADPSACVAGTLPTTDGGGAGGSFSSRGGAGSRAKGGATDSAGVAGAPVTVFPPQLRGGCPGQDGAMAGTTGGHGGGAVAVIATTITLDGDINASGGAGRGGTKATVGGGAGGGAGGMIFLDASSVVAQDNGRLWANGGAGGQGGSPIYIGNDGGESPRPAAPANGTSGSGGGSTGGNGSVQAGPGSGGADNGETGCGGGGGGGGGGVIHAPGITDTSKISPQSTPP